MGWHGSAPLRPTLTPMRLWWRLLLWVVFALWGVVLIRLDHRTGEIFTSFLHRPLLIFHEAGHVLFIPLGDWMAVAGGSLMQLIVPAVLAGALLLKNHDRFGASIGVWFFGVSLLDLAPYIYDALVPQLTLLNGETGEAGGHDWIFLLSSMGWLAKAHFLGGLTHKLGALVVLGASAWGALVLWQHWRGTADDGPLDSD
jgi:hypothetical protein